MTEPFGGNPLIEQLAIRETIKKTATINMLAAAEDLANAGAILGMAIPRRNGARDAYIAILPTTTPDTALVFRASLYPENQDQLTINVGKIDYEGFRRLREFGSSYPFYTDIDFTILTEPYQITHSITNTQAALLELMTGVLFPTPSTQTK